MSTFTLTSTFSICKNSPMTLTLLEGWLWISFKKVQRLHWRNIEGINAAHMCCSFQEHQNGTFVNDDEWEKIHWNIHWCNTYEASARKIFVWKIEACPTCGRSRLGKLGKSVCSSHNCWMENTLHRHASNVRSQSMPSAMQFSGLCSNKCEKVWLGCKMCFQGCPCSLELLEDKISKNLHSSGWLCLCFSVSCPKCKFAVPAEAPCASALTFVYCCIYEWSPSSDVVV